MRLTVLLGLVLCFDVIADPANLDKNKALRMYELFYLPFAVEVRGESNSPRLVLMPKNPRSGLSRAMDSVEVASLDARWDDQRRRWKTQSLFERLVLPTSTSVKIAETLHAHSILATTSIEVRLALDDRLVLRQNAAKYAPETTATFKQQRFLERLASSAPTDKTFHFFLIAPSWCPSSKEYTVILEKLILSRRAKELAFHLVRIEDPEKTFFESVFNRSLFPFNRSKDEQTTPRFISLERTDGASVVLTEGAALRALRERFLFPLAGMLDGGNQAADATKVSSPRKPSSTPTMRTIRAED